MALTDNISINSILGSGSSVKGDVKINGFARIDGDIDGNLETTGNIIIGEKARIRGNVTGRSVTVIGGIVLILSHRNLSDCFQPAQSSATSRQRSFIRKKT